jgi:hypothetical protein
MLGGRGGGYINLGFKHAIRIHTWLLGVLFNDCLSRIFLKYLKDVPFVSLTKSLKIPYDSQRCYNILS